MSRATDAGMKNVLLALSCISAFALVGCGGDSEPAKSADDAAASERAAEHAEDKADAAADKADSAADKADQKADETK
jgi:hypothetical protein